jgi:hypothetical protein
MSLISVSKQLSTLEAGDFSSVHFKHSSEIAPVIYLMYFSKLEYFHSSEHITAPHTLHKTRLFGSGRS